MEQGESFTAPATLATLTNDQQDLFGSHGSPHKKREESPASSNNDSIKPTIATDATNNSGIASTSAGTESRAEKQAEKKRKLEKEREKKRLAEEEYNSELSERRYKRLMHLLDKSQFYANLILNKNDGKSKSSSPAKVQRKTKPLSKKAPPKKVATKRKIAVPKENSPIKRPRRTVRWREESDLKDFVTNSNITRKLRDRKNLKKLPVDVLEDDEQEESVLESSHEEVLAMSVDTPSTSDETGQAEVFSPPEYFVGELRDYQIEGLKWLQVLNNNGLNGILADEMGLGKTIQVIALFCDLIEKSQGGPFLVIAPLSTIPNWLVEFEKFAPHLPVVLFHGPPEERSAACRKIRQKHLIKNGFKTQPIVITTYEVPFYEKSFFQTQKWRYIVIDEGHRIKNPKCQLVKILKKLKSMNRLLLTGTPLQNNLAELWSLLNFLLPEIFNDLAVFESWFDVKELQHEEGTMKFLQQEEQKKVVASLREILKPFMLRRVKTDVCLEIPPKKEIIVYAPLTELQRDLYKAVLNRDLQTLCKIEDQPVIVDVDGVRPKRQCVLRRSCDSLYSKALQMNNSSLDSSQDMIRSSSGSTASVDSNDSLDWKPDNENDVWSDFSNFDPIFKGKSQSVCENKPSTSPANYVSEHKIQKMISDVKNSELSCNPSSSGGKNLNHVLEFGSKNSLIFNLNKMVVDDDTNELPEGSLLCNEKIQYCTPSNSGNNIMMKMQVSELRKGANKAKMSKKSLENDKEKIRKEEICKANFESDEDYSSEKDSNTGSSNKSDKQHQDLMMWKQYTDVNERNREFFIHLTFGTRLPMYKKIVNHPYLMHCPLDSTGLPMVDEDLIKASGKLMVLDQMLPELKGRGHKILLFSTWTKILDILEDYLTLRSYSYVRLDGATSIEKRKENIHIFNSNPKVFLFLISTRAGGVGLNLAGADTVIIYDSDWNPQADIQAMARCHRIGQTKPVVVYRFCTRGTIDEEITKRADAKRKLEKMVISKKDLGPNLANKDTLLKLKQLLESKDCQVVSSKEDAFTEQELGKLLDRSDLIEEPQSGKSSQTKNVLRTSKLENSQES